MTARDDDPVVSRRRLRRVCAALVLLALLPACSGSGADGEAGAAESTGPTAPTSASTSSTPAAAGTTGGEAPAYTVPASCAPLGADPGSSLPGPAVATCWGDALQAHGSVRAWTNGPPAMEAEVVLSPSLLLRTEASDGRVVVVVDGAAYSSIDGRWVAGVLNSDVEDEALVAATGEFATSSFSPQGLGQGIRECATWKVASARDTVTLHDGSEALGLVRLDCLAPFDSLGATTADAALWVREDWTPVRHASTLSVAGVDAEFLKELTDHGSRFDIPTPGR